MMHEEALQATPCGRCRRIGGKEDEVVGIARPRETGETMAVYRTPDAEGELQARPAAGGNEEIIDDGKTRHQVNRMDRIKRVEKYELLFDEALASHDPEKPRMLDAYYSSGQWREDYEADERGEFPPDLKRGVLSQDALYDLLVESLEETQPSSSCQPLQQ